MKTIFGGKTGLVLLLLVVLLLAGLPVAVWLDLTNLAETNLKRQASDLNSIISSVRSYYANNVVGRILAAPGVPTKVAHNYAGDPRGHSHSGDAVARTRQGDQRTTTQHHLSLRFGLSVRQPRAASARCSSRPMRFAGCAKIPIK